MKKYVIVPSALLIFSFYSNAQSTTRQHIETALTDPKAAENAAKADAMLINKKNIMDTFSYDTSKNPHANDNRSLNKRKKKSPDKKH